MNILVLLNLLSKSGKRDEMRGLIFLYGPSHDGHTS